MVCQWVQMLNYFKVKLLWFNNSNSSRNCYTMRSLEPFRISPQRLTYQCCQLLSRRCHHLRTIANWNGPNQSQHHKWTHPGKTGISNLLQFSSFKIDFQILPFTSTPQTDTRPNCAAHSRRRANANTAKNANLPMAKMNCATYNVIRNTRPNIVAHFTALDYAHMDHVAISCMICVTMKILHVHVLWAAVAMATAMKMVVQRSNQIVDMVLLAVTWFRMKLIQLQRPLVSWAPSKTNQCGIQIAHLAVVHLL